MRGHRDLDLVAIATAVCAVGSLIVPLGSVRVVFAVPLTLVLPGYAIAMAVIAPRRIGWVELVPLTAGISLAALALSGIVLNYTPGGLRGIPWVVLLAAIVLGCRRVAARRRGRAPARQSSLQIPRAAPATVLLLAGCLAMSAAAFVLAQRTVSADRALGYTELWTTPTGESDRRPKVGVTSQQQHTTTYRLEVRREDRPLPIVRAFTLTPGESHTVGLGIRPPRSTTRYEATLFKRGRPDQVYRRVFGWLPANPRASG